MPGMAIWLLLFALWPAWGWAATRVTGAHEPTYESVNEIFGLPLWSGESLWTEPADEVAGRLGWRLSSSAQGESTYRVYPRGNRRVLGARIFCMALHAVHGRVGEMVLVYTNQFDPSSGLETDGEGDRTTAPGGKFQERVNQEGAAVELTLTQLWGLGHPCSNHDLSDPQEHVRRWDWSGNTCLLDVSPGRYVVVTVVFSDSLDEQGRFRPLSAARKEFDFAKNVEHRPNADVVISGVPMVRQGHSDFCGPATWERYLRYRGIPADMYLLGIAGHAGWGGKLLLLNLEQAVDELGINYGKNIESVAPDLTLSNVAKYVETGTPLVWACNNPPALEDEITHRSEERKDPANWNRYREAAVAFQNKYAHDLLLAGVASPFAHLRLIIGYNPVSRELAISDSFGPSSAERWITLAEAKAISLGYLRVIE